MRSLIIEAYREAVALAPCPEELKKSLATHERTPQFLDNLERELSALPPRFLDPITIRTTVYDLTNLFIRNVDKQAQERYMTDVTRSAAIAARDAAIKRDELADRLNAGESVDLSEII